MSHYQSKGDRNEAQLKKGGRTAGTGYQRAGGQAAPSKGGGAGGPGPSGGAPPAQVAQQSFSPLPSPRGGLPGASGNRGGKRTNGPAGSTRGNPGGGGFDHGGNYYKVVPPPFSYQQQPPVQAPLPPPPPTQLHPQQQQPHQQAQHTSQQPQPPLQHQQAQDAVARQRMVSPHSSQKPQMIATSQADHEMLTPSSVPPQSPTSVVGPVPNRAPGVPSRGGLKVAVPTSPLASDQPLPAPVAAASPELGRTAPFSFQFGSLSPGFMQIPARTSSAPPNLDEQKWEQARFESARTVQTGKVPTGLPAQHQPKQQSQQPVQQLGQLQLQLQQQSQQQSQQQGPQQGPHQMQGATYNGIRSVEQLNETAAQLHHGPMGNSYILQQQAQQPLNSGLPSSEAQLQYSQGPSHLPPQPPHTSPRMQLPVQPPLHLQIEGLPVQMQGQMPGVQVPQLFTTQGIGQKGLVQQGMGQMKFPPTMLPPPHNIIAGSPIGGQLSPQQLQPQLVHQLGGQMSLGGQLPPSIAGNHYGQPHFIQQRTSKAVKIVHPETHEELRFDGKGKKGEAYLGNASQGPPSPGLPGRVSGNGPQQPRPSFQAGRLHHQGMNYFAPYGPSQQSYYSTVGSKAGVPPGPQINSPTGRYGYPPAPSQGPYAGNPASSPLQPASQLGPHGSISLGLPSPATEVLISPSQALPNVGPAVPAQSALPPVGVRQASTVPVQPTQLIAEHSIPLSVRPQIVVTIPDSASTTPCSSPVVAFQFGDVESASSPVVSGSAAELPVGHSLASTQVSSSAAEWEASLSDEATTLSTGEPVWRPASGGRGPTGRGSGSMKASSAAAISPKVETSSPAVSGGSYNQGDKARLETGKPPGLKETNRKYSKKEQRQQRQLQQQQQQQSAQQQQRLQPLDPQELTSVQSFVPNEALSSAESASATFLDDSCPVSTLDRSLETPCDLLSLAAGKPDRSLTAESTPLEANVIPAVGYVNAAENRADTLLEEKGETVGPDSASEIVDSRRPVGVAATPVKEASAVATVHDAGAGDLLLVKESNTADVLSSAVPAEAEDAGPLNNASVVNPGQPIPGTLDVGVSVNAAENRADTLLEEKEETVGPDSASEIVDSRRPVGVAATPVKEASAVATVHDAGAGDLLLVKESNTADVLSSVVPAEAEDAGPLNNASVVNPGQPISGTLDVGVSVNAAENRADTLLEEKGETVGPDSASDIVDSRRPVGVAATPVKEASAVATVHDAGAGDLLLVKESNTADVLSSVVPAEAEDAGPLNNASVVNPGQPISGTLDVGVSVQDGKAGREHASLPHRDGDTAVVHISHIQSSKGAGNQPGAPSAVTEQGTVSLQTSVPELKQGSKKKKKKELLAKADAAGTTADLYNAYKAPDEKKAEEVKQTDPDGFSSASSDQIINSAASLKKPVVKDLDDWEDAAELPTPKATSGPVTSSALTAAPQGASISFDERKYTRDFILTFKDLHRELPPLFEFKPDIAEVLLNPHILAAGYGDRDTLPSPGRGLDRQLSSGPRLERRPSMGATGDDDRWVKQSGLVPPPGRGHPDGNIQGPAFWPGQGTNAGLISRMPPGVRPGMVPNQMMGLIPGAGVLPHMIGASPSTARPNGVDADRWQRAPPAQKGLIPSPRNVLPAIHRTENRYEVGRVSDEEESKQRQIKGILNKLTPQNFEKLFAQVKDANIDSASTLTGVISQIFDKALTEPTFCEMYARFCVQLAAELPEFVEEGEKITFKRVLLNKCQEEFERGEQEQKAAESLEEEGEVKVLQEERSERRLKARRRMLGNIRFIGELYKKAMLTERIMHECIQKLLGEYQNPDEEDVEALCNLMSTIGRIIDHQKAKDHINVYFLRIETLSNNMKLSSRLRFMLKDVIDLRKAGWQERRKVEGPKRIDEVHRDAVQERQAALAQAGRRGSMATPRGRPAPPPEFSRGGASHFSQQSGASSPVGGSRGSQGGARSTFGQDVRLQDVRMEDRLMEGRPVPIPLQAKVAEEGSLTLGPQGGLGRGIGGRSQSSIPSRSSLADVSTSPVTDRRHGGSAVPGYSTTAAADRGHLVRDELPPRPSLERSHSNLSDRPLLDRQLSSKEVQALERSLGDTSSGLSLSSNVLFGPVTASSHVPTTAPAQLSDEDLRKKTESTIQEFYSVRDMKEAAQCVEDFRSPKFHSTLVSIWVSDALDRKDVERALLVSLVLHLWKADPQLLTTDQIVKGFGTVIAVLEDTRVDVPKAPEYLATMFGKLLVADVLTLNQVAKLLNQEQESGESIEVRVVLNMFADVLNVVRAEKGETAMCDMYRASGLHIEDFLSPEEISKGDEIEIMLQKKQLQCLYPMIPIERHIRDALQRDEPPTDILGWIEKNVQQPIQSQAGFLQLIMTQVLRHCIPPSASSQYDKYRAKIRKYAPLLKKVAAGKAKAAEANQRQYIVAVQLFANELGHPPGLMPFLFESFYRDEVISEGAYQKWQDDVSDPTPGRDKAIREVGRWLMALAQEEGGDEED